MTKRLVLVLLWLAQPAWAWDQYHTLAPGDDGALRGCGIRWPTNQIPLALDDGTLDGLETVDVPAIAAASGQAWEGVQCALCQVCRNGQQVPESCATHALGLSLQWQPRGKPSAIGATCVASQPDGSCNAVDGNGNWVNFVHDQQTWESQGVGSLVVALTVLTYDRNSGEIRDADVLLDDWSHDFCVAPACGAAAYDLQSTLTHEFGHVFGLDHSANVDATMFAGAGPGESNKRSLENDDITGLCTAYSATCNGCAEAPSGGCQTRGAVVAGQWLALLTLLLLLSVWATIRRARN